MFPLQAILDVEAAGRAGWAPRDLAAAFLDGGARFIQIRAKRLASGPFLELCDAVMTLARPARAAVIVNDRLDLARLCGADGAHVGQDDLPASEARALLGPDAIVGYSTHSVAQVEAAARLPLSYIAVGPVFGTTSKDTGYGAVGVELVREAVRRAGGMPIVAIGGVTIANAPEVFAAGGSCVAVISDLLATGDPAKRVKEYVTALGTP